MSAIENTTVKEALQVPEVTETAAVENAATSTLTEAVPNASNKANPAKNGESSKPHISLQDSLLQRVSTIKEGDNVLLRMPSDMVKAVVASQDGLVQLGKFGAFPAKQLLGRHYDVTYEIYQSPNAIIPEAGSSSSGPASFGQGKGKKKKSGGGNGGGKGNVMSNPGWKNALKPLKEKAIIDAVVDDIKETNEFIDDTEINQSDLLSQDEIAALREQGVSAEELIQRQIERHERFGLKTEFSKEKWRQRKEKKYRQTIHPMAPTANNITNHNAARSPQSILHLREDTLSQLLVSANIRPGGRYLVVDDTGGLVTAAMMERMGCEGRIMTFTENDSPPAWGVLGIMNFNEREMDCVRWLNWMEADEGYQRPPPPPEDDMPAMALNKRIQRLRKAHNQVSELNAKRDELHLGGWDAIVLATELSPMSILSRLSPYLMGSSQIVVYSPYLQVLAEILQHTKKQVEYLNPTITESWSRTYQVLPGRTHPLMMTSGTGGYLFHATKIFPSTFQAESNQHFNRKKGRGGKAKGGDVEGAEAEEGEGEGEGEGESEGEGNAAGEVEEHDAIDEALDAEQEDIAMDN